MMILDYLTQHKTLDYIGVNYYSRHLVHGHNCKNIHHPLKKNSLGWDIYPEGLAQVLLSLKKYDLPVIIAENGICTSDDNERWAYIQSHLKNVHLSMEQGVNVVGYIYWSLMDNFEWAQGYAPRFGLVHVDYKTQIRTARPSAKEFAQICRTGALDA